MKLSEKTKDALANVPDDDSTVFFKDDGMMDWKRLGKSVGLWLVLTMIPILILVLLPRRLQ
jgi:hypothetical protein